MLIFHSVEVEQEIQRTNPLYVGNFFSLKGMWWSKRKQRQALILSIAVGWYRMMQRNPLSPGFVEDEVLITALTRQVKDAKVILERFFKIVRTGYNFNDGNKAPTLVTPRKLRSGMVRAIEAIINDVKFVPGLPPLDKCKLTTSTVTVRRNRAPFIRMRLKEELREDLLPAVNWLLDQEESLTFYYEPAGNLLARDKSVWPIKSIEMWPGWLRTELFGRVIDIENAYVQFVVKKLEEKYSSKLNLLELKYPDLLRADRDKKNFRVEMCYLIGLEPTDDNLSVIKKLIMSLANGSNATPALMTNGSGRSEAVRIVLEANPDLLPSELIKIGSRLNIIAKQFKAAKRDMCLYLLNAKPSRDNMKKIFSLYLKWERECRYKIHDVIGGTGLMLHDGLDGVQHDSEDDELIKLIGDKTNIRVSVESPVMETA